MKKKLIANKYHGFTLTELMMVISIMAIMGGVGLVSLQSSKVNTRLRAAQREVAAAIKQAQSYALQGKMQGAAKVCGYGVRFNGDTSTYEIFYKIPVSSKTCTTADTDYTSHENVEILKLENGVVLSSPVVANTEIYFAIPFGQIFDSSGSSFNSSTMTFEYPAGSGVTKSIEINSHGNITEI